VSDNLYGFSFGFAAFTAESVRILLIAIEATPLAKYYHQFTTVSLDTGGQRRTRTDKTSLII
jgi:hypothetical protein